MDDCGQLKGTKSSACVANSHEPAECLTDGPTDRAPARSQNGTDHYYRWCSLQKCVVDSKKKSHIPATERPASLPGTTIAEQGLGCRRRHHHPHDNHQDHSPLVPSPQINQNRIESVAGVGRRSGDEEKLFSIFLPRLQHQLHDMTGKIESPIPATD